MARARPNVEVVRRLRRLDGRPADAEDQQVLARWSGWGAVPGVFNPADDRFAAVRTELSELLTPDELAAAARNTLNAHYTDAALAAAIWQGLGRLGFSGGRILEPGCGAGVFIGLAPPDVEAVGVELDPTTAAVTQALYPDAKLRPESFADSRLPDGHFDVAVGNVPFGDIRLHDPVHNRGRHTIHNHFIVKALHLTRPGGLVAVLTSRYTLDARNPAARREMAMLGDLVGAVRLPEGAHRRAAGTDVVTDLLVFRRRYPDEPPRGADFEQTTPWGTDTLNEYFAARPDRVLGDLYVGRGIYRDGELLVSGDLDQLPGRLAEALGTLASDAANTGLTMGEAPPSAPQRRVALVAAAARRPEGFLAVDGDGFVQVTAGQLLPFAVAATQRAELRQLLRLRDTMVGLLEAEASSVDDTPEIAALRSELNRRYDRYVDKFGPLNRCSWRRTGRLDPDTGEQRMAQIRPARGQFREDPFAAGVDGMESYDPETGQATKQAIFFRRTIAPPPLRLGAEVPADALAICLEAVGEVRLDEIARLLGVDEAAAAEQLRGLVFEEPGSGRLVAAAEYLSGNVRTKLAAAEAAAEADSRFADNVAALRDVVPPDIGPGDIDARLGATWIEARFVQQFLAETLEDSSVRVEHAGGSQWVVRGGRFGVLATSTWGTQKQSAGELAERLLKQAPVYVHDTVDGKRVANPTETVAAQEKAAELADRFSEWVWEDPARSEQLVRAYNDRFNNLVLRSYDGVERALPGLALNFTPRPHQLAAVTRMVSEPSVLLAHEVGAGKTAAMVMGLMELHRLGLVRKPALVVPNHMIEQFAREFAQLYPQARLLIGDRRAVAGAEGRRRFVGRAAAGEWDAVIVSHSAFERIPLGAEHRQAYFERETDRIRRWIANSERAGGLSVKKLQAALVRAEEQLKRRLDTGKADAGIAFEHTGIDYLCVDEAHLFKNLRTVSDIPGAGIEGSQRAQDLDMKIDWLRRSGAGRHHVTFATATPIANSVTEAYVMLRFLRPDLLDDAGLEDFDSWAATFGQVVSAVELTPDGGSFRMQSRFARFTNVPELLKMLHVPADVKTAEDLNLPTPALTGGGAETVVVEPSPELRAFVDDLGSRAERVRGWGVEPGEDNMLSITNDGRAAALDLRLVGQDRPQEATKTDVAAERIAAIWADHRNDLFLDDDGAPDPVPGALQLVFCDLGTPSADWNVYDELRDQLAARGVPRSAVRFVHDAKDDRAKGELFAACRSGRVAVLVGSTAKMGVGTNVQRRAVALHHLDCPWRPADLAQREGRILRQGNLNPEVQILRYVTEGSFDTYLWQTVERKARFIGQLMRARLDVREIEDIGSDALSYAEVKALAAGDPRLIEKAQVDSDLAKLERLSRAWSRNQTHLNIQIDALDAEEPLRRTALDQTRAAIERRVPTRGDAFTMTVDNLRFTSRSDAGAALYGRIRRELAAHRTAHLRDLGHVAAVGGLPVAATITHDKAGPRVDLRLVGVPDWTTALRPADLNSARPHGIVVRLEKRLDTLEQLAQTIEQRLDTIASERARAAAGLGTTFPQSAELHRLRSRAQQLSAVIASEATGDPAPPHDQSVDAPPSTTTLVAAAYPAGIRGPATGPHLPGTPPSAHQEPALER